jgi:hypothetical protein
MTHDTNGTPSNHDTRSEQRPVAETNGFVPDQGLPEFDDPEDLTPEERLTAIVRILARGVIRLAEAEHGAAKEPSSPPSQSNGFEPSH